MGVIQSWILCALFQCLVTYAGSSPVGESAESYHIVPFIAKRSDGSAVCDADEASKWTNGFHECFIQRKYKDGGRNLNSIVDRILYHGEACVELSSRECRPDFQGFLSIMNKTISQIKDYAEMYLEEIYKGRENIKDLRCVEAVIFVRTYENCFRDIVPQGLTLSEERFQKMVHQGLRCTNYRNSDCSKEAKTSLNRIVRIILGIEQPDVEKFDEEKPTTVQTTTKEIEVKPTEPRGSGEKNFEEKVKPTEPRWSGEKNFEEKVKPTEAPAPMMWYDYLAYPFVQAWKWISGLFG